MRTARRRRRHSVGYANTSDAQDSSGSFARTRALNFVLYESTHFGHNIALDALAGTSTLNAATFRTDATTAAAGTRTGEQTFGALVARYRGTTGRLTLEPFAQVMLGRTALEPFAESGSNVSRP
jgi:uncharacterized protein with beta-barrel porin domain